MGEDPPVTVGGNTLNGPHDGYMQRHPVTGKLLAYLAYGGLGMTILDLEDPANPKQVSEWNDYSVLGAARPEYIFMHSALPMPDLWEGRHITFMGEECFGQRRTMPSCVIFVFDTTDPAKPTFVSAWTLPVETLWKSTYDYSTHYVAVRNRTLFVTVYHAGVWAVDVSTPEALRTLPSVGAFMPSNVSPKPAPRSSPPSLFDYTPMVLELDAMADGTLVLYDTSSGLYTVEFDPSSPAPPPEPWPLGFNE